MAQAKVVIYTVDNDTQVQFEIDPPPGFRPAGTGKVAGRVRDAVEPAVQAAREVLERTRDLAPDQVQVTFGVKVTGTASWLVARAAAEGNFQVTLSWSPTLDQDPEAGI